MFDPQKIKLDFPILQRQVNGQPLVYLDNAATSQKPQVVINAISNYYQQHNANVHRGVHTLSDEATHEFEASRATIAQFFGAQTEELILTRNATEAINGVAYGWGLDNLKSGDVILTTMMEHHANIVPWQQLCGRVGAKLEFVQVTNEGKLDLDDLETKVKQAGDKLKLITLVHISNTLGSVNPIEQVVKLVKHQIPSTKSSQGSPSGQAKFNSQKIKYHGPLILVDGAQSAPHLQVNFDKLGIDFYAFSGHKMLGPMGIGGLLVRKELLVSEVMQPWLFGGGMINEVHTNETKFNEDLSERFIAGTPDVASAVGLAAACKYLKNLGMDAVEQHDRELVNYALKALKELEASGELKVVGPVEDRVGSVAFIHKFVHAHDVAQILDSIGVAVRSGHHCCMPLHESCGWAATVRASFQIYNEKTDVDRLVEGLEKVKKTFLV